MAFNRIPRWETEWRQVGRHAFAYVQESGAWGISNAGLIVGEDDALVVDALFTPSMTRAFVRHIEETTNLPVRNLVNTHHHGDHTYGNAYFKQAEQYCHVNCLKQLEEWGRTTDRLQAFLPWFKEELEQVEVVFPTHTFEDRLSFEMGNRTVEVVYAGRSAHTRGDAMVYLPDEKLLYAGDVAFLYVTPLAFEGHVTSWIAVCDTIMAMDVEKIVPGHGPIGTKDDLALMRDYLALLRDAAQRGFERGLTPLECARTVQLGAYAQWADDERIVANIHRLYAEMTGVGDGPLDFPTLVADMRAWGAHESGAVC